MDNGRKGKDWGKDRTGSQEKGNRGGGELRARGEEGKKREGGGKNRTFQKTYPLPKIRNIWRGIWHFHQNFKKCFQMEKNLPPNYYCYFLFQAQNKHTNCWNTNSPAWQENMSPKHFNQWLHWLQETGYRFDLKGVKHWWSDTQNKNGCSVDSLREFHDTSQLSFSLPVKCEDTLLHSMWH